jgi:hypothetical protein
MLKTLMIGKVLDGKFSKISSTYEQEQTSKFEEMMSKLIIRMDAMLNILTAMMAKLN